MVRMTMKNFYERRALEYSRVDREGIARYRIALRMVDLAEGCAVLDVGCKGGHLRDILREQGTQVHYTGVDISETVLGMVEGPGDAFRQSDVMDGLPFGDGAFDVAFCLELVEHVENPSFVVRELKRVVKPDGAIVLSAPNPYYYEEFLANLLHRPDTEGHISTFTPRAIRRLVSFQGLDVERTTGTWIRVPYWPFRPVRSGRYFLMRLCPALLACSVIYRVARAR